MIGQADGEVSKQYLQKRLYVIVIDESETRYFLFLLDPMKYRLKRKICSKFMNVKYLEDISIIDILYRCMYVLYLGKDLERRFIMSMIRKAFLFI